jgi:hypothetical protein
MYRDTPNTSILNVLHVIYRENIMLVHWDTYTYIFGAVSVRGAVPDTYRYIFCVSHVPGCKPVHTVCTRKCVTYV